MGESGGTDWRAILWSLLKPALVAAIVALLVAMGVTGLRPPSEMGGVGVMSGTHLSGPLLVTGGISSGNNVTVTGDLDVSGSASYTSMTVEDPFVDSSGSFRVNDDVLITGTVGVSSLVSVGNGLTTAGGITMTTDGLINANGAVTVTDGLVVSGLVAAANGLSASGGVTVAGNITMGAGDIVNAQGAVTVTDQLAVSSQVNAGNGVDVTGNVTVSGGVDIGGVSLATDGALVVGGDLYTTGGLGVASLIYGENGLDVAGGITSTGMLSVTNWASFYGLGLGPMQTAVVTTNVAITVGNYSFIGVDSTDAGDAGVVINLDGTACVSDGAFQGQIVVLTLIDTDAPTVYLHCGKNLLCDADPSFVKVGDTWTLLWDGADWLIVGFWTQ